MGRRYQNLVSRFIVGVKDLRWTPELSSFLREFPVEGLILFNSPHDHPDHLWKDPDLALEALHEFLSKASEQIHFLSVDQEGGRVQRLRKPFVSLPPAQTLHSWTKDWGEQVFVRSLYESLAKQMRIAQILWNFAPVCDLRTNESSDVVGDRSFSSDPKEVIAEARHFCEAMRSEGILSTLKHFPGHGGSQIDSHLAIATLENHPEERKIHRQIFEELASSADAIMPGHLAYAEQADVILSLDKVFITQSKTQFSQHLLWVTDDLATMKAVSELRPWRKALAAGYDYLLLCGSLDQSVRAIEDSIRFSEESDFSYGSKKAALPHLYRPKTFKKWAQEITEIGSRANDEIQKLLETKR